MILRSVRSSKVWRGTVVILCIFMWIWLLATYDTGSHETVIINVIQAKTRSESSNKADNMIEHNQKLNLPEPVPVPPPPSAVSQFTSVQQMALEEIEASVRAQIPQEAYRNHSQIVLAATWRTGSTFFAEAINSHPWIFYHYEPLSELQIAENPELVKRTIDQLAFCNYRYVPEYLKTVKMDSTMLMRNNKIKKPCEFVGDDCFDPNFLSEACNHFPVQLLKTVRMQLSSVEESLQSPDFHVIFLVRDPRAIYASRLKLEWCTEDGTCSNPDIMCNTLKTDLVTYKKLSSRYPKQLHLIRYEDLAKEPLKTMQTTFANLKIPWNAAVEKYIEEHTNAELDNPWTTYRISRLRINNWKPTLPADMVGYIQDICDDFMHELNYTRIDVSLCREFC